MTFFGVIFFFLRWQLPRIYGAEPAVTVLCAEVLPIVAAFQILVGTQVVWLQAFYVALDELVRLHFSTWGDTTFLPFHWPIPRVKAGLGTTGHCTEA